MAASLIPVSGFITCSKTHQPFFTRNPTSVPQWHLIGGQQCRFFTRTSRGRALCVLATSNISSGRRRLGKEVIMVDPLEAKKLADKQMVEIKAKEKLERRSQIEAINGAWAMIGLTVGLVIEGQTGKGFIGQLIGYWDAVLGLFLGLELPFGQ